MPSVAPPVPWVVPDVVGWPLLLTLIAVTGFGYGPVPEDGILGLATRAALARWQVNNFMTPTGVVDAAVRQQLGLKGSQLTAN